MGSRSSKIFATSSRNSDSNRPISWSGTLSEASSSSSLRGDIPPKWRGWYSSMRDTCPSPTAAHERRSSAGGVPAWARLLMPGGARAELEAIDRTEDQIRASGPFPPVPVRILTATRRPESMPNLRRVWAETQADFRSLSPMAKQTICTTCGHYIQLDAPDLVREAIEEILHETRD